MMAGDKKSDERKAFMSLARISQIEWLSQRAAKLERQLREAEARELRTRLEGLDATCDYGTQLAPCRRPVSKDT